MTYTEFEETLYDNIKNLSEINIQLNVKSTQNYETGHLTNYLIIRACGTIEQGLKLLIANHFSAKTQDNYLHNYLEETIVKSSSNPSESMIIGFLSKFDSSKKLKKLYPSCEYFNKTQSYSALDSLRNLRNQIAHGDRVSISHNIVNDYLDSSILLMLIIREVLKKEY